MNILGISAYYHDSAAALVRDGEIVAAAQEERFTRRKHDFGFPVNAIEYCLAEARIQHEDLDLVAYYDKPLLKFDRILETYIAYAPRGFKLFRLGLPLWLKEKLHLPREMDKGLKGVFKGRYIFTEHHQSHAASAFFPSPFEDAVLTMDGVGEWATGSIAHGVGNEITMLKEMRFPHSLGLLYSAFTFYTGFKVNSGEYKLMGLAPYGEPVYRDPILDRLVAERGAPDVIVVDNGPEFTSRALDAWAYENGVRLHFIQPGKPTQNCFVESFNGKFRDECLSEHWFADIPHTRRIVEIWRRDYNEVRPHSALGNIPPREFAGRAA